MAKGGAVLREERHIGNECMRSHQKGEFRPAIRAGGGGGGGGAGPDTKSGRGGGGRGCCPLQVRYEKWGGGGGGGEGCLPYDDTMIYIFVLCARA